MRDIQSDGCVFVSLQALVEVMEIFVDLACGLDLAKVEPAWGKQRRQFVGVGKEGGLHAVLASCGSRVIKAQIVPFRAKESAHDFSAELRMRFAFLAVEVGFAEIAEIMNKKCNPEPRIQRWAVELRPCCGHENGVE